MTKFIRNYDDILSMLDELLMEKSMIDWDRFYSDRKKNIPFFINYPDENLVHYFEHQLLKAGRVLELGCGPGRNAIYLAEKGCTVDAVDLSTEAIDWAKERAMERDVDVQFHCGNLFELEFEEGVYDIVYDSGCFHHIAPHRRISYLSLLTKSLKPGGHFAITCFVEDGEFGGSPITDLEVYKKRSLQGGLGFTAEKIRTIFSDFEEIEIRKMKEVDSESHLFGVTGLWTALFKKKD